MSEEAEDVVPTMTADEIEAARIAAAAPPPEPETWLRIEGGIVVNAEAHSDEPKAVDGVTWMRSDTGGIGWTLKAGKLSPPPASPPTEREMGYQERLVANLGEALGLEPTQIATLFAKAAAAN